MGMFLGAMVGYIRVIRCTEHNRANFIAADLCINSILAVAAKTADNLPQKMEMYNVVGDLSCSVSSSKFQSF